MLEEEEVFREIIIDKKSMNKIKICLDTFLSIDLY